MIVEQQKILDENKLVLHRVNRIETRELPQLRVKSVIFTICCEVRKLKAVELSSDFFIAYST